MLARLLAALILFAYPAVAQPNIVLILVDDFSMNLMPTPADALTGDMPNLARMVKDGMTFSRSYVTESRCCPSRASTFTGMMPHNTGVLTNTGPLGGLPSFTAHGDEAKVFALPMQAGGYKTAFMGKYLNGWRPGVHDDPPGWQRFVSTNNGYAGYDYTLSDDGVLSYPLDHFTDRIAELGRTWITLRHQPFILELAPFAPHSPYVPAARHEGLFLDVIMPKTPAYDFRPEATAPAWLQIIPPLTPGNVSVMDGKYILRKQANKSVDQMIGDVRTKLNNLGIAGNTYVIFTSDNGYHMGEFGLKPGKQTPFDFDVQVPMVIVGPGIAPGSTSDQIVMNIDLAPTFLELAGLPPNAAHDGRSLVPLFSGGTNGRTVAVVEHTMDGYDPNDPDATEPPAGEPPTYTALRTATAMYVEYATGEVGYYLDQYQLHNVEASLTTAERARLHDAVAANATCAGATCRAVQER